MAIYRMQCTFAGDTAFARDKVMINPHFKDSSVPFLVQNVGNLVNDLASGLQTWCLPAGTREITVTAYDAEGPAPHPPLATKVLNPGAAPGAGGPRELALCLSFYGGENTPRKRGRLYIPLFVPGIGYGAPRPDATARAKVGALVPIFTGLGGVDVDWCVWSRTNQAAYSVTNWWVDDEWDVQRRRGLKPSTRLTGTTSE